MEAAQELERQKFRGELPDTTSEHKVTSSLFSPAQWMIMGLVGVVFTGLMIWIASQIGIVGC